MRLVSFRHAGAAKFGLVVEGGIVDLSARLSSRWPSLRAAIAAKALGELAAAAKGASADLKFEDVELDPVVPDPEKILCIGLNYASHVGEVGRQLPTVPSVFSRLHNTLVPHGGDIVRPRASIDFDFEGELAIVIGERCRHVPRASALSVIAGYTCFVDGSVRDYQKFSVTSGKNFPGTGPLGPWIVTADEIGDPQTLKVEVRVNGEPRATGDTRAMLFPFEEILAYASQDETVHAGEVFGSGTVGNCCGLEIGRFLESGDTVELSVDRIGVLKNTVLRQA